MIALLAPRRIALSLLRHDARRRLRLLFVALLSLSVMAISINPFIRRRLLASTSSSTSDGECEISLGAYGGHIYDHRDVGPASSTSIPRFETMNNVCLVESPWMRVARHTVRLSRPVATATSEGKGGRRKDDDISTVLDDWLWIDYHDRINVLVEAPPTQSSSTSDPNMQSEYLILEQSKYALDDPSLAIVGGIVEKDEYNLDAAKREVLEEMDVTCRRWTFLGNSGGASSGGGGGGGYRTDVNRGMGWVYPYLAEDCTYVTSGGGGGVDDDGDDRRDVVGGRDVEERSVRRMTLHEVRAAVMDGKFVEVQWSNTVALAMLHLLSPSPHPGRGLIAGRGGEYH